MTAYLGGEPIHALTTGTHYAGAAQGAVDEKTGFASENYRTETGAPWATTTATPDDSRVFEVLAGERNTIGAVVTIANPTDRCFLSLTAGHTAELNVVNTDGAATQVDSSSDVSTSANMTFIWLGRYRPEVGLAMPATASLAHLSDLTNTYGGTASDFGLEIDPATGILQAKVWRYGASPTTLSSGERADDGKLWAAALTISSTTGTLYVQTAGGSLSAGTSGTVAAHSAQINQRFRIGRANTLYLPVGTAAAIYLTVALTRGEIVNLLANLRDVWSYNDAQMVWVPTAADVTAGTSITDQAGNHNATTPNAWDEIPNSLEAIQYSRPVFGHPPTKSALRHDGLTAGSATAASLVVPATYSLIFGFRLPLGADINNASPFCIFGNGTTANHDIFLRFINGKIRANALRISGVAQFGDSSTVFAADNTVHIVQVAMDNVARTATLYVDGTAEVSLTSVSAHVASAVAKLEFAGVGAARERVDIIGPAVIVAGVFSTTDALTIFRAGADPYRDPRYLNYFPLADNGTNYGSEAANLTLTATSWVTDVDVSTSTSLLGGLPRSARVVVPWARSAVTEISIRIHDPDNADASIVLPFFELFDGDVMSGHNQPRELAASIAASDTGTGRHGERSISFDLWLTRQEASRISAYAGTGRRVLFAARVSDDALGEWTRSVYGQVQSVDLKEFYAIADSTTYRYSTRVTILEAP